MKRLLIVALTALALCSVDLSTARAQRVSDSALARCARISGSTGRLQCYDRLARNADPAPGASPRASPPLGAARFGKWMVREETNPLDDSKTVALLLSAQEGRTGLLQEAPSLVVRCRSGEVQIYIDWQNYMGSDASAVTTRLGTAPSEVNEWTHSTDNQATFYPDDAVKLLQSLLDADRFVAQATPYSESPVTAVFVLTGLTRAVVPLKAACGLK